VLIKVVVLQSLILWEAFWVELEIIMMMDFLIIPLLVVVESTLDDLLIWVAVKQANRVAIKICGY
jgi:hypothetical protein